MQEQLFYTKGSMQKTFREDLHKGHVQDCPCCGRHAQVYHRPFHSSMALQLIALYRLGGTAEYIHVSKLVLPGNSGSADFAKARYWGLIHPKDRDDRGKASCYWILSHEGEKFVRGIISIPAEVQVFDDNVMGFGTETITIRDALGSKFDYEKLMRG